MKNKPQLTVALPLYKSQRIAWLALESLCNQEHVNFDWELIICEENGKTHEAFTEAALRPYLERLKAVRCVRVEYVGLNRWVPLSQKWVKMAQLSSPSSTAFVLQAGDCYSEPLRLRRTYDLITQGADWVHSHKGVFLNLKDNTKAVYHHPSNYPTALNMAIDLALLQDLPSATVKKGVDRWLFNEATKAKGSRLNVVVNNSPKWHNGIDTHGFNNISVKRRLKINQLRAPFFKCKGKQLIVSNMLPNNVVVRLKQLTGK